MGHDVTGERASSDPPAPVAAPDRCWRIAIVGCGSAGPAAALYLARAGHEVDLFERAPALGPVGTGFILQPTGLWVLEELGLRRAVETDGARLIGLRARTARGRPVLDLEYHRLASDAYGLGMHRATLLDRLVSGFSGCGVRLHLDAEVEGAPLRHGKRRLQVGGVETGPYDLVIVANGARSRARAWTGSRTRSRRYPWGALWSIVPDPERLFPERLEQVLEGCHTMLGLLPTGMRSDDPARMPLVSLFWSLRRDRVEATLAGGARALLDRIRALEPRAEGLLAGLEDPGRWAFAEYHDVVMPRWHGPAIVVLGDAAHAMSPQLGQGVNLALCDARELARALVRSETLETGLADYSARRRRHLAFYQRATRWLTPFFQSDYASAARLRDALLPLLGRLPPIERQMLATMAGLKTGALRSLPWPSTQHAGSAPRRRGRGRGDPLV